MGNVCEHESEQQKKRLTANILLRSGITTGKKIRKEMGGGEKKLQEGQAYDPNHGRTNSLEDACNSHDGVVGCLHKEDLSAQESEETNEEGAAAGGVPLCEDCDGYCG